MSVAFDNRPVMSTFGQIVPADALGPALDTVIDCETELPFIH